jgi:ABC-type nitrate/sulfonate/bicarbonate transport system substrate-binding protein
MFQYRPSHSPGFQRISPKKRDFIGQKDSKSISSLWNLKSPLQGLIAGDVGYTTALGSTMRWAIRGLPLRVVMAIADKPLFALIARPGINFVDELRGKLLGFHPLAQAQIALARAVLRRYKINPNGDLKILALDGGTNRIAAMETWAVDAALIEAPYNLILERKGFRKILFVGDIIPTPLAGFGTRIEKIHKARNPAL